MIDVILYKPWKLANVGLHELVNLYVKKMNLPLKGIIPPVVTPLINNNNLDYNGLEALIEHLINGGVHGLFMLGTTG